MAALAPPAAGWLVPETIRHYRLTLEVIQQAEAKSAEAAAAFARAGGERLLGVG